ncbi:MAG: nucleotidyltransferase family protein [Eubacteriales bacterium]|nr:nucleotidyltransferase family protein [Eubacteriales bacterium]
MTEKSRTEYSAKNTVVAIIARAFAILMGFAARVVFTHTLSQEYVGINGLFTDILNVLALSELGVGTAITYALYKPIADRDIEKQKSLMRMYKRFYQLVAGFVFAAGMMVVPFMDILIKDRPNVRHLTWIYLIYLLNTVLSYLWVYKRTLVDAHQLSYIGVVYQTSSWFIQNVLQIIILLTTKNFILYLSAMLVCTIGNNLCISRKADSLYPYLKEKAIKELPKAEKDSIFQSIRAMLVHKIGNVAVNNTDNLLLSALVGTISVSCYSNYFLIIGSVRQVLVQVFQGITASVGNMGVTERKERIEKIFYALFFMGQWMYGLATICLYEAIDLFVGLSFGKQYVFDQSITLVLCLNFYVTGMRQATLIFRESMGLFRYDKMKAVAEAVINLIVSLILGYYWGTIGVFLGTMISTITTSFWVEPYILYKHKLKSSCLPYFVKYSMYALLTFLLWYGMDLLCKQIEGNLWFVCVSRVIVCFAIVNIVYFLCYWRTKEFQLLWEKGKMLVANRIGKTKKNDKELTKEQLTLLSLLCHALKGEQNLMWDEDIDWNAVLRIADAHKVTPFLYESFMQHPTFHQEVKNQIALTTQVTVAQNYRLLLLDKYLVEKLQQQDVSVAILKGLATASYYEYPEYRKTGDVDLLLLEKGQLEKACVVLKGLGFYVTEEQHALHHIVFSSDEGIDIELHTVLSEPFDNQRMNRYMEQRTSECKDYICTCQVAGIELPSLGPAYHAFELLIHMLQHFLRAGFGLKLLCDWVVFWNQPISKDEQQLYLKLIEACGIKGFSDQVTSVCCRYLGLHEKNIAFMQIDRCDDMEFMSEVFEAEEFGKSSAKRMVALRGDHIKDFIREFHHQMRLNYAKASRCILLWPILWGITLLRFLTNNRRLERGSTRAIMKSARQRGKIIKKMKLFHVKLIDKM